MGKQNRYNILLLCLIVTMALSGPVDAITHNVVNKVFYHNSKTKQDIPSYSIEIAQLMICCAHEPELRVEVKQVGKMHQRIFHIAHMQLKDNSVQKMIEELNATALHRAYTIKLEKNVGPNSEIVLSITYDPEQVALAWEKTDTIQKDKGFVVHIYDRQVISKLQERQSPVLQFAHNERQPCVVIDCGHGGEDAGAISPTGLAEKDITLVLGKMVMDQLGAFPVQVVLTREHDETVSLTQRTDKVKELAGSLVVSIHANSALNNSAQGIETFCLGYTPTHDAHSLTKQEKGIVLDRWGKIAQKSQLLAQTIHEHVINNVVQKNAVVDRRVKKSVSQLLLSSGVPSALIEVGFLSHLQESQHLACPGYQKLLAQGICQGILRYLGLV